MAKEPLSAAAKSRKLVCFPTCIANILTCLRHRRRIVPLGSRLGGISFQEDCQGSQETVRILTKQESKRWPPRNAVARYVMLLGRYTIKTVLVHNTNALSISSVLTRVS